MSLAFVTYACAAQSGLVVPHGLIHGISSRHPAEFPLPRSLCEAGLMHSSPLSRDHVPMVGVRVLNTASGRTTNPPNMPPTMDFCPKLPEIDFFRRFSVIFYN